MVFKGRARFPKHWKTFSKIPSKTYIAARRVENTYVAQVLH